MYPIAHITCDIKRGYSSSNWFMSMKERFTTTVVAESFIKELGIKISEVNLPPNYNKMAFSKNIRVAVKKVGVSDVQVAPKTWRLYDMNIYSKFQKVFFAYSVINSVKVILRLSNKNISSSCIAIYDAGDEINKEIIIEAAKNCRYLILVSNNMDKLNKLCNYIIYEYGISPIITNDTMYAFNDADFIISSKRLSLNREVFIWHIDNSYEKEFQNSKAVNNVLYKVPWDCEYSTMDSELLAAILCQTGCKKNVEEVIKYNGIYLDSITYNEKAIQL